MADKLSPKIVSLSLASISGIAYIFCAIFFAIAPQVALGFFKNMFHGVDITRIASAAIPPGNTIAGFVEIIGLSLVAGWLFALIYNYLQTKIK